MKKTIILAVFAAAAALFACTKETNQNNEESQGEVIEITSLIASLESCDDTKTELAYDDVEQNYKVNWQTGDAFTLMSNGGSSATFTLTTGAGTTSATFTGSLSSTSNPFFAIYPSSLGASKADGKVNFTLPQSQAGSLSAAGGVLPAVAYSNEKDPNSLSFKNICGIFRIKLTGSATIGKLELYDLGGAMLWGEAKFTANSTLADPATWGFSLTNGDNKLIVDFSSSPVTLTESPTMFYFVVPAGTLSSGARVVIYDNTDKAIDEFCTAKDLTVARSVVKPMKSIAVGNYRLLDLEGCANCYIADRTNTSVPYKFCAVTGNDQSAVLSTVSSVTDLWEAMAQGDSFNNGNTGWLINNVNYSAGCISFSALNRCGNAVIAAKNSSDKILWSWHIWLPNDAVGQATLGNGNVFMDRNLGAMHDCTNTTATGLLYQWGRKDPFTAPYRISYSSLMATSPTDIMTNHTSVETIAWSIQNPTSFIYLSSGGKWFSDSAQTWETTLKSIYDPCPPGWRVPSSGDYGDLTFGDWDDTNKRRQETGGQYFTGTGRRFYGSGGITINSATDGYYWVRNNSGNNMTTAFTCSSSKAFTSSDNHRKDFGLAVRCVKE